MQAGGVGGSGLLMATLPAGASIGSIIITSIITLTHLFRHLFPIFVTIITPTGIIFVLPYY